MKYFLFLIMGISPLFALSQNVLKGMVTDPFGEPLAAANVQLMDTVQKNIIDYTITDNQGKFKIQINQNGKFLLKVSYLSYETHTEIITIKENQTLIKNVELFPKSETLGEVVIVGEKGIATQKGDTISYNLDKLTTGNEQKLKDVIKKIPGLSINDNGQIIANGKKVDDFLINGKKAFGNNHKIATDNIDAEMLEGIDLLTNYEEFGAMKDIEGSDKTALNINIKKEYLGRITGDVEAFGAYKKQYKVHSNLFRFDTKSNISAIVDLNNTGEQVLSIMDYINMNMSIKRDIRNQTSLNNSGFNSFKMPSFLTEENDVRKRHSEFVSFDFSYYPSKKISLNGYSIFNFINSEESNFSELTFFDNLTGLAQNDAETAKNRFFFNQTKLDLDFKPDQNNLINYSVVFNPNKSRKRKNTLNRVATDTTQYNEYGNSFDYSFGQQLSYIFRLDKTKLLSFNAFQEIQKSDNDYDLKSNHFLFDKDFMAMSQNKTTKTNQGGFFAKYTQKFNKQILSANTGFTVDNRHFSIENPFLNNTKKNELKTNLKAYFADLILKKNKGFLQYNLTASIRNSIIKSKGQKSAFTHFLPSANIKFQIKPTHTIALSYNRSFDFPSIENTNDSYYVSDFRNLYIPSLIGFDQVFIKNRFSLNYLNVNLFSGTTLIGLASLTLADKSVATNSNNFSNYNEIQNVLSTKSYHNFNANLTFQQRLNGFINHNKFSLTGSYNHIKSFNFIGGQSNPSTMDFYAINPSIQSNFDKAFFNYEIGINLSFQEYEYDLLASKNKITTISPFINLDGKIDKLNLRYFIKNTYEIYNTAGIQRKFYNLGFKLLYDNPDSKLKYWIKGNDVLNISHPELVTITTDNNMFARNVISQLAGYIGIGFSYKF